MNANQRGRIIAWPAILLLICALWAPLASAGQYRTRQVLVLNSYHKGFYWVDNIVKGIESIFASKKIDVELSVEYMDSKTIAFNAAYKELLYKLYAYKYSRKKFDVIISSDDNALNFLREYHNQIFPDTPIVFCGVNNLAAADIVDRRYFTGVLEISAEKETLDLALRLSPKTKQVVIITDSTPTGIYRWHQLETLFNDYPHIKFIRLDDRLSISEIEEAMMALPDDAIAVFETLYRDKSGRYISLAEGVSRVSKASRRPIYTFHTQVLQYGTIGGKLLGGFQQGEKSAKMAIRILEGEKVSSIPIYGETLAQYTFDYLQLQRFGIKSSDLPKGSIIKNVPFSFYKEYKLAVWATTLVFLILTTTIAVLKLNIVKRRQAECALRESERLYRLLADNVTDVIWIRNLNLQLTYISPSVANLTGYSVEENMDKTPKGNSISDPLLPAVDIFAEELATEKERPIDAFRSRMIQQKISCKDGSTIWTESKMSLLRNHLGEPIGFIGVTRDISERKQLESQLQQSQKMEAIGTLAGGIAHDFNNILYAIIGFIELALEDIPEGNRAVENLHEVFNGAMRAKEMVQQILAFSRKADTEKMPVMIQSIVKEASRLLRTSLPSTIAIHENIDMDCRPVLADATQIHQVVMNLSTNAYHAMRNNGGVLELSVMEEQIGSDDPELDLFPGTYLKLAVRDNGHGIDHAIMDKIFNPYFTTKGPGEGTGMGLAVVHGIVKNHCGDIKVSSELGTGTTFYVYFPLINAGPAEPESETIEATLHGDERILLVDDEKAIVAMTQQILGRLGYQVTPHTSSVEAFNTFKANPDGYDLVVTDMTMPNMTGLKLASGLRKIRPGIPIIICTGFSELINGNLAKSLGINGFVMKPVTKGDIARTVRQVLDAQKSK